jgi:O-antigen/teichoic acid export membrane protein
MPLSHRSQLLWSYTSALSNTFLQAVAAVTITRFVAPAEYGLVALAMMCCRFPNYLSQLGMSRAVVQKPDLSEGNVRAAFTLSMGLGLAGCLAIAALSPLPAQFFHEPRLMPVLVVLSLNFIFQGAILVSGGLLRRALKMRQLAIADTLSYLISTFAIGLPIAIKGYGAWAIVASTVTQTLITAMLYYAASPHALRPTLCRSNYEHIVGFGGKATATSIIEGLGGSMDTLMLGKFSTAFNVGLYNRSSLLIQLPVQNISNGLTRVLFSRFSRASAQGSADAFDLLARFQRIFLAIVFPLCAGAAGAASCIVLTLYGSKWISTIPVFAILCAAVAADASHHLPGIQMEALGRFRHKMIVQLLYLICIGGGVYLSVSHGLVMVGVTITGLTLIRSLGLHFYTAQYLNRGFTVLLSSWVPGLTAALLVGGAIVFVAGVLLKHPGVSTVLQLIVCILTGLGVSSAFYGIFYRKSVFDPLMALMGIRRMKGPVSDSPLRMT